MALRGLLFSLVVLPWMLWMTGAQATACEYGIPPDNPDSVYVDHGDGTITDIRTGLMWKQCPEGLSGADCGDGVVGSYTWSGALAHVEANQGFAGYDDWRLPNMKELFSLVENCRIFPTINERIFPETGIFYWSSSPALEGPNRSYALVFSFGLTGTLSRSFLAEVRMVRDAYTVLR